MFKIGPEFIASFQHWRQKKRAHFYEACQQFLELPLEQQAEHVSEFLTTLISQTKSDKFLHCNEDLLHFKK
ncbi:hypothetical protein E3J79_02665 [Candidatus Dependentiae bacterium]|nr:MAG: hypothetical protein E3J79_02665 [Candidatus Dependentiae bacterium]